MPEQPRCQLLALRRREAPRQPRFGQRKVAGRDNDRGLAHRAIPAAKASTSRASWMRSSGLRMMVAAPWTGVPPTVPSSPRSTTIALGIAPSHFSVGREVVPWGTEARGAGPLVRRAARERRETVAGGGPSRRPAVGERLGWPRRPVGRPPAAVGRGGRPQGQGTGPGGAGQGRGTPRGLLPPHPFAFPLPQPLGVPPDEPPRRGRPRPLRPLLASPPLRPERPSPPACSPRITSLFTP